jgi:DNA-binding XRE family transcriptional regulator
MARAYDDMITHEVPTDPDLARFTTATQAHFETAYQLTFGLGETLAARRTELHLSQVDLANLTGITQADISRIERGKGNPTLTTLEKILDALQLRMDLRPVA